MLKLLTLAALLLPVTAAVSQAVDGPPMDEFKSTIEPLIRQQLVDPEDAEITWPYRSVVFKGDVITCGVIHGNNRVGGRIRAWVVVNSSRHLKNSSAPYFSILDGADGQNTMCDAWMQRGQLVAR